MDTLQRKLDFARPPVEEVVLSVLFNPLDRLLAPHLGEIWQEFKKGGFAHIVEQPPVPPAVEMPVSAQGAQLHFSNVPDLARICFIHQTDTEIIQVQRDRFTFNWRKSGPDPVYPGFSAICEKFEGFYTRFIQTVKNMQIGEVAPAQYELTYIDQLRHGDGWETLDNIGKIYPLFSHSSQTQSFWSGMEAVNFHASFPVEDLHGRLHLALSNRIKMPEQTPILQTDFTVRGFPEGTEDAVIEWFKSARDHIRAKFVSMFSDDIQTRIWGRK